MEIVQQLAVFLDNRPGALSRVCNALAEEKINMFALSTSDTIDHTVLRMVVSEPKRAIDIIEERGALVVEDDVLMLALDTGADDVARDGDHWRVECEPSQVAAVSDALSAAGQTVLSADAPLIAENAIQVDDLDTARKILRVMSAIEDNDDVQDVFANFDMTEEMMEEAAE